MRVLARRSKHRPELPSVLHVRADRGPRLFPAKLPVIVHYLLHQLLDDLMADDAILLARQFCDCLRDRVDVLALC